MRQWLSRVMVVVGLLLLGGSGAYLGMAAIASYQASQFKPEELPAEARIAAPGRVGPGEQDTPSVSSQPPIIRHYSEPTHVWIESIDVDAAVVPVGVITNAKGELEWETPKNAVGHNAGTALPGLDGNTVLSGHMSSPVRHEGNVFNRLPDVRLGDLVRVQTDEGVYSYQVVGRRVVEPTEVSVMDPTPAQTLTLITCYPDLIYSHRMVLRAEPVAFEPTGSHS